MKQTFEIPEGCNRVTIEQQGRQIITTFEPKFKDGDIISGDGVHFVFIFKTERDAYVGIDARGILVLENYKHAGSNNNGYRHATEEEKQKLFDAMAKDGKCWNAETKQVEDIKPKRWRAESNKDYWYLDSFLIASKDSDQFALYNFNRYNSGNYFKTKEQAEAAAEKIKELLKQINP